MKKSILISLISCLLYSCYDYHHYLPKDKIPLSKNNDIVSFRDSASSKIDTFRLSVNDNWWQSQEGEYFQNIAIFYNRLKSKETFFVFGITSASVDGANFGIEQYSSKIAYGNSSKTIDFTIQGNTYSNVYVGYDNSVLQSDTIPNKVYFTCPNGIIRYEYKDGRVYNLISK